MKKITPCLWFDGNAEEAMNLLHLDLPEREGRRASALWPRPVPATAGSVLTASFELEGTRFTALNGGPHFKFNEAISFQIACETQDEVDYYWESSARADRYQPCGGSRTSSASPGRRPPALPRLLADHRSAPGEARDAGRCCRCRSSRSLAERAA
jgi:predicted 3-demethylubiquinone-9 3-methyltransferase (glyoxalase superfamily)